VKSPAKTNETLAGNVWFYYGARYGEYLSRIGNASAADYLPSSVERSPGDPNAYLQLGDFYADSGQRAQALAQYDNVLQLDSDRGDAHDHAARALWSERKRADAIARWRAAIAAFERVQGKGVRVPEAFWNQVAETFSDIGDRRVVSELRPDMQRLLTDYIQRNGAYRLDAVIEAAAEASVKSGEGIAWLLEPSRGAQNPDAIIPSLMLLPDVTAQQRIELQRERIAYSERELDAAHGYEREYLLGSILRARMDFISMLLDAREAKAAQTEWSSLPDTPRGRDTEAAALIEMRLSSHNGTLARLLERYRSASERAPSVETLRTAAAALERDGDDSDALAVLEFLYERELRDGHFESANFLGLADVRLRQKNTTDAVRILRRMALVAEDAFDTLLPATDLLERCGQSGEAAEFIERRARSTPWDADAKIRAAAVRPAAERNALLMSVLTDGQTGYATRVKAADNLHSTVPSVVAGTELALVASGSVDPKAAQKPFYVESRLRAAAVASNPDIQLDLYREALAIAPTDERVRLGVLRSALKQRRDNLALATVRQRPMDGNPPAAYGYLRRRRPSALVPDIPSESFLPGATLSAAERVSIAEDLASAAERIDDLRLAESYLKAAIAGLPDAQRRPVQNRLKSLEDELARRASNAARQPVVRDVIEQDRVVSPRTVRSVQ
jgi:tetratricopeptide (TPR) repeat protein